MGAGDLYFDNHLPQRYTEDRAYAVDLEYDRSVPGLKVVEDHCFYASLPLLVICGKVG